MTLLNDWVHSPGYLALGIVITTVFALAIKHTAPFGTEKIDKMSKRISDDERDALYSGANDVLVVKQDDNSLKSSPLNVFVGKFENWETFFQSRENKEAEIHVNGQKVPGITIEIGESGVAELIGSEKTCKFTESQLMQMELRDGMNKASFVVEELDVEIPFSIFLYDQKTKLILTDIDGTITTSDVRGFLGASLGYDVHHEGVFEFLHKVAKQGYVIIYLTARPIALDLETRKYLFEDPENDENGYRLPQHPLFLTPAVMSEAALGDSTDHTNIKTQTLKNLIALFNNKSNQIYGAYGNKNSDTKAYRNIGITDNKIFIIDKQSNMINVGTQKPTSYKEHALDIDKMYSSEIEI